MGGGVVSVGVAVAVAVAVGVNVAVAVGVKMTVGVAVAVAVVIAVAVDVGVGVKVAVAAGVGVGVKVAVGVGDGLGVGVAIPAHCENSDVSIGLPEASRRVAVAVATVSPVGSGNISGPKVAVQLSFVVTFIVPRKCAPSPKPDGSQEAFEKNSRRKLVFDELFSVPEIVTIPPPNEADVITGKF